jgi:timeless
VVEYATSDEAFDYKGFVLRFASRSVCAGFGHLFKRYRDNSDHTNHCIVKMFHRIAYDCNLPAMLFQVAILKVFQKVGQDRKVLKGNKAIEELYKFGKYILGNIFYHIYQFYYNTSRGARS